MTQDGPLFLLGCPRSGTTLLGGLLGPSRWGEPVETHFITKYAPEGTGSLRDRNRFRRLVQRIASERPVRSWRVPIDADALYERCSRFDYAELVHEICMTRSRSLGHASWGDKTPHFLLQVELLADLFPNATFLYIVRDGRDVALSLMERPWGPGTVYHCAQYWKACNAERPVLDRLKKNGSLYQLKYEDLLDNGEAVLRGVFDFLQQPIDDNLLAKTCARIRPGNYGKWRRVLKPAEVRVFDQVAGSTLERFGYESRAESSTPPAVMRGWWTIRDKSKHAANLFRMNVVDTVKIRYFGKDPFGE